MSLYSRLSANDETKITVHSFSSAIRLAVLGVSGFNVASIVSTFGLSPSEENELQSLANTYVSLDLNLRRDWLEKLESVFILIENGMLNESQSKNILGF